MNHTKIHNHDYNSHSNTRPAPAGLWADWLPPMVGTRSPAQARQGLVRSEGIPGGGGRGRRDAADVLEPKWLRMTV